MQFFKYFAAFFLLVVKKAENHLCFFELKSVYEVLLFFLLVLANIITFLTPVEFFLLIFVFLITINYEDIFRIMTSFFEELKSYFNTLNYFQDLKKHHYCLIN